METEKPQEVWMVFPDLVTVPLNFWKSTYKPSEIWPSGVKGYQHMPARVKDYVEKYYQIAHDFSSAQVQSAIDKIFADNIESIENGNGYSYKIQSRTSKLMEFQPGIGLVLRREETPAKYEYRKHTEKAVAITHILDVVSEAARKDLPVSHRGVFYHKDDTLRDSRFTSARIYDVACMLNCRLSSLYLLPESKGSVYGPLTINLANGKNLNCLDLIDGQRIPADLSQILSFEYTEAECIVVVEKLSLFHHLIRTKLYSKRKVILVTGSGMPDFACRAFLKMLELKTKLQIYCIVDPDPHGFKILCTYAFGSVTMSYDNMGLAVPSIVWIDITLRDLYVEKVPERYFCEIPPSELKVLRNLLCQKYLKYLIPGNWKSAMKFMYKDKRKARLDSLNYNNLSYLGEVFIPKKLDPKCLEQLGTSVTRVGRVAEQVDGDDSEFEMEMDLL